MKQRKCTICGQLENEYTYFCTECGAKTNEYSGGNISNQNTITLNSNNLNTIIGTKEANDKSDAKSEAVEQYIESQNNVVDNPITEIAVNQTNNCASSVNKAAQAQADSALKISIRIDKKWLYMSAAGVILLLVVIVCLAIPKKKEDMQVGDYSSNTENGNVQNINENYYENNSDFEKGNYDISEKREVKDIPQEEQYVEEEGKDIYKYYDETGIHEYELVVADISWSEAYAQCLQCGGHLVRINSDDEYVAILQQIRQEDKENIKFWIGGSRRDDEYNYYWIYGDDYSIGNVSINNNSSYENYWLEGEPTFFDETTEAIENRMNMFYMKSIDRWVFNDVPDDILSVASFYAGTVGYICEYE